MWRKFPEIIRKEKIKYFPRNYLKGCPVSCIDLIHTRKQGNPLYD